MSPADDQLTHPGLAGRRFAGDTSTSAPASFGIVQIKLESNTCVTQSPKDTPGREVDRQAQNPGGPPGAAILTYRQTAWKTASELHTFNGPPKRAITVSDPSNAAE